MQTFNEYSARKTTAILAPNSFAIKNVEFSQKGNSIVFEQDSIPSRCLRCIFPRCQNFSSTEIKCAKIDAFPSFENTSVCPINAISFNEKSGIPQIDSGRCLKCGLCAKRCPTGAIFFENGIFTIKTDLSHEYQEIPISENIVQKQNEQISALLNAGHAGEILRESDDLFQNIYDLLVRLDNEKQNLLARNILLELGCFASLRRSGDVYTRMDMILQTSDGELGSVEIEFAADTLSAVRGILDDVAMLADRYKIPKEKNYPLIVCLFLPNNRQGFWQVVKDIKNVLKININTVTIGMLLLLLWNFKYFEKGVYYIDSDNRSLRNLSEKILMRKITLSERFLGILEPQK